MIYLNKIKYKTLILTILSVIFISNFLLAYSHILLRNNKNTTKYSLLDSWNLVTDKSASVITVTIPYFITDKTVNSIEFNKLFSIDDTVKYSKLRLWIIGLHGHAYIYINEILLKEHINLPTTYFIDINPNILKKENNDIKIQLTKLDKKGISQDLRYPNYPKQFRPLGIAREIYLEYIPKKYIDNIDIKYKNNNIYFNYELNITDSAKSLIDKTIKVEEEILSPSGISIFKRFEYFANKALNKSINRQVNIKFPEEWSSKSPKLYKLKLSIKSGTSYYDINELNFGLREIKLIGPRIELNNKPIIINGINYRYNFTNNFNYIKNSLYDLKRIKDLGFNSVRFINYPPHPATVSYADSIGLYLFIDNGIWRLPSSYFNNNKFFNDGKSAIKDIGESFRLNPSIIGIGIGNESNTSFPREQKFTIMLKKYLNDNFNFLTYLTPIDNDVKAPAKLCDFLLIQNYTNPESMFLFSENYQMMNIPILLGSIHFPEIVLDSTQYTEHRLYNLQRFFAKYDSLNTFNGYFIESFNDWIAEKPNLYTKIESNETYRYPFGLFDINQNKFSKYNLFSDFLKNENINVSAHKNGIKNNFHSLMVFIMAIVFFLIYKRNYRLKENLSRSIQHPYGFFVDIRDRRIISIFNSTLMGITIGTISASFLSALIYAFHTSIYFNEYVNIFIPDNQNKLLFLEILESPWKLFLIIFIILTLIQLIFAFILKFLNMFSKEKRKIRQIYSIISWSGSPFLFFIPIALFAYNFAINNLFYPEIIWIFLLFLVWFNFRIANGFRVLYLIQPAKMLLLVFLTYLILIISFLVYINMDIEVFEHIKTLRAAQNLY